MSGNKLPTFKMFSTQKSMLNQEADDQRDDKSEDFYFNDGYACKKSTILKLLKSKDVNSRQKLNLIVTKIIEEDHQDAFGYLLQNKYSMNALNHRRQTAVHLAFYNKCRKILFMLGIYLLDVHDHSNYIDCNGLTYLHVACYMDNAAVAEKFLSNDIDINCPFYLNFEGYDANFTLLHFAVTQSSLDVVKLLLEHGAYVNVVDSLGRTALHLACSIFEFSQTYHGINVEIMKVLLENESIINGKDLNNNTPLMSIFPDNYFEFQVFKRTSLMNIIVFVETLEKVKLLIQQGADINMSNNKGDTILHLVIRNMRQLRCSSDNLFISFADTAHVEMVRMILSVNQKVNINAKNNVGETPIQVAVASMSVNIVQMLLNHDIDLSGLKFNHKDPTWFYHPLFIPNLESIRQVISIIELLILKGFKLSLEDNLTVLKFLIHDFDECECGSIHDIPNSWDKRFYFIHLLQYGSLEHIKHITRNALSKLSTMYEEQIVAVIGHYIGEYLRLVKMADIYIDPEVFKIFQNCNISHNSLYPLTQITSEVDQMKYTKLDNNITMYDLMVQNPLDICSFVKANNVFDEIQKFSCYKEIIQGHIAKSVVRNYVMSSASAYLRILLCPALPDFCCCVIAEYLSNEEILFVCMAVTT